jgi:Protein of unknown function (DUF3108)
MRARCIVRRKAARQRIVSDWVHTNSMTKLSATTAILAALTCAAGAVYWARGLGSSARVSRKSQPAEVSAMPAIPEKTAVADPPASAKLSEPADRPAPSDQATPLRAGEVLEFAADVAKLSNVANLRLQIVERRNFFGKSAWHLQAVAHTESPLRMVFELDDQFDSYSDAATLSSLQYEMHLNERGEKQESIQRMTTTGAEGAAANATQTRVLPGTRDPLGLMQYLRTVDWEKVREVHGPVYDGHKLYDVRASYLGPAQNIAVPAGTFSTSKIDLRVFEAGAELKDAHFTLYLAGNPSRTPVLLEAVMPFATARVALVKMK